MVLGTCLVDVLWCVIAVLFVLLMGFVWLLVCQLRQVAHLNTWLKSPKKQHISIDGSVPFFGDWQGIYDELLRIENGHQKRAERLNKTIHRLNRMMTAIPSAVLIINEKKGIEWKNAKADEYLSLQNEPLPLDKQINDDGFCSFLSSLLPHKTNSKQPDDSSIEQTLKFNQKTLHCTLIPIEANATMLIAHDMTASEQLNVSKNAFIANVSHELRTPLTVIQGFLETLSENELDRALQLEFIGLMYQQSERMLDLIEGLLTLSRLENDDSPIKLPVNLSKLMMSIIKDAKALSKTHKMDTNITDDVWVMGVYKELYSAFGNLIFNAIHHTAGGTQIDIDLSVDGGQAVFFVKDNGEGISSEHLSHLTERFYRVDKGRSRKTGGSGLGLAITKHILARHHAILTITSEVGVGSNFGVKIPCANPPN